MLFNSEAEANTAAATEVNYSTQHYSRTRTAVTLVHNRSKILHLNLNALSWQSGGIAKHTSRGAGLYPCFEIAPNQSMVFVATAKSVSMFTGVTGSMQYHGRFVQPSAAGPPAAPSAFADPNTPTQPTATGGRGPVELGVALDFTFENPYAGAYKSFAEGTPIEWTDPNSTASPGKAPVIGNLDPLAFDAYKEMMHEAGGSFCLPLPQYAQDLVLGSSAKGNGRGRGGGVSTAYLRVGYLPVSTMLMTYIVEDAIFDYAAQIQSIPRPHMPHATGAALLGQPLEGKKHAVQPIQDTPGSIVHAMSFRLMQYNCFLRPNFVSYDGQAERAQRVGQVLTDYTRRDDPLVDLTGTGALSHHGRGGPEVVVHTGWKPGEDGVEASDYTSPKALLDYALRLHPDILVVTELFTLQDTVTEVLAKAGLIYHTGKLSCSACIINGGVAVFSRYPIIDAKQLIFPGSASSGKDYLSAKGVVYTKVRKMVTLKCGRAATKDIHLFSTHLQAAGSKGAEVARAKQLRLMRLMTRRFHFTPFDTVAYAGDFSIPMRDADAFDSMTETLGCFVPSFVGGVSTSVPQSDLAVREGRIFKDELGDWVDYVLCSREHCPPLRYLLEALSDSANKTLVLEEAEEGSSSHAQPTSTEDYVDSARFLKASPVRNFKLSSSLCLQVLPDFKAKEVFTVQWNKWKSNSTHSIQDLSAHYPVFTEVEAPLFTRDWNLTAEARDGEKQHDNERSMYYPPNPSSPGTDVQQLHGKDADKRREVNKHNWADDDKAVQKAISILGDDGTNEPATPDEVSSPTAESTVSMHEL